ncbi:excreted/secreted protein 66 [Trypanosoma rangeli]|uniref:Excreted/secreted protein 66 n=1 Tax=Trypanosoma rangeli TaxID=5698 RepID=A0A3R7LDY0_TRYRA|nr:excreted/secreted protein 66 [Trypanosoma rangeli]RNF12481.1 excreted/secreted protein 66 [Trypanosoma rangeli]|eukprot:RNF12481.1 excreted/secreted protein 66 [Trypanosoma rangeli]
MFDAFIFDAGTLYRVSQENGELICRNVECLIPPGAVVTCFSADEFYFVARDTTHVLRRWRVSLGCTDYAPPGPVHKVLVHRQKVYCCGRDCMYVFDPLAEEFETWALQRKASDVEVADQGFVFVAGKKELYAYHFNQCLSRVNVTGKYFQILGRYGRYVAVLVNSNQIVCVNENGAVWKNIFTYTIRTPFITADAGALLTIEKGGTLRLYAQDTAVTGRKFQGGTPKLLDVPLAQPEDLCLICLCEFEDGGGITLDCGHRFHRDCVIDFSARADDFRARGEHVVFTYAVCPGGCGMQIRHAAFPLSEYMGFLRREIDGDAEVRLREMKYKMVEDLLYYICCRCGKPFYGGERRCFRSNNAEPVKKPSELICSDCNDDFLCPNHKHDYVLYKCKYCCNPATHLSFGNRYLCNRCDKRWETTEPELIPCPGPDKCPLQESHSTDGSIALGCMLCTSFNAMHADLFFGS